MLIIALRTDQPEAEIAVYSGEECLSSFSWLAHRELAETIHLKLKEQLQKHSKKIHDIEALAVYKGPGSFTGLRIGISVSNALAYSLNIPVVSETGDNWQNKAIRRLLNGENEGISLPDYGAPPHITKPKK